MISNCDKVTPGMLMAAARVNIPAISVTGGPMAAGMLQRQKNKLLHNVFEAVGQVFAGKMTEGRIVRDGRKSPVQDAAPATACSPPTPWHA